MLKTTEFDASEYIRNDADAIGLLEAAAEEGDPAVIQAALGAIAKARGMSDIARRAGLSRESLYRALRADAAPTFKTISAVASALGARVTFVPGAESAVDAEPAKTGTRPKATGAQRAA